MEEREERAGAHFGAARHCGQGRVLDPASARTEMSNLFFVLILWWARRDSNPRPPACEAGAHPNVFNYLGLGREVSMGFRGGGHAGT
jgi:hypothetical protein